MFACDNVYLESNDDIISIEYFIGKQLILINNYYDVRHVYGFNFSGDF